MKQILKDIQSRYLSIITYYHFIIITILLFCIYPMIDSMVESKKISLEISVEIVEFTSHDSSVHKTV